MLIRVSKECSLLESVLLSGTPQRTEDSRCVLIIYVQRFIATVPVSNIPTYSNFLWNSGNGMNIFVTVPRFVISVLWCPFVYLRDLVFGT